MGFRLDRYLHFFAAWGIWRFSDDLLYLGAAMRPDRDTLRAVFERLIVIDEHTDWQALEMAYRDLRKGVARQAHQDAIDNMMWEGGIYD